MSNRTAWRLALVFLVVAWVAVLYVGWVAYQDFTDGFTAFLSILERALTS